MISLEELLKLQGIELPEDINHIEFERSLAEWYNKQQGKLTGYDCKKCLNKGYSKKVNEDGELVFVECECMPIRRKIEEDRISEAYRNWRLNQN